MPSLNAQDLPGTQLGLWPHARPLPRRSSGIAASAGPRTACRAPGTGREKGEDRSVDTGDEQGPSGKAPHLCTPRAPQRQHFRVTLGDSAEAHPILTVHPGKLMGLP